MCAVERSTLWSRQENRRLQKMTSYTEDEEEEEEDDYNLGRRGLQLATSVDCIRIDKN